MSQALPIALPVVDAVDATQPAPYGTWRAWYALVVMSVQMLFVGIDCSIVTLLVAPVEGAFRLDDVAFATITATAFSVGYSLVSYPAGVFCDAFNRRDLIAFGSFVWAGAGVLAVVANSPAGLFVARAFAGIGTVIMGVAMLPLLYDAFPRNQRALANGTFQSGTAVGTGIGLTLCGVIVETTRGYGTVHMLGLSVAPWQQCFVAVAVCGVICGAIMLTVREPVRRDLVVAHRANVRDTANGFVRYMRRNAFMWIAFFVAFDVASIVANGVAAWAPAFATRRFGGNEVALMGILGTMQSAGSLIGAVAGGFLATLLVRHERSNLLPRMLAVLTLLDCAAYAIFPYAGSWTLSAAGIGLGSAAAAALVVLVFVGIQEAAPNEVRGQLFGIFCGLSFVPGIAGPTAVAVLSVHLVAWGGGLAPAFTIVSVITGVAGAALYVMCERPFADAVREFRGAVS